MADLFQGTTSEARLLADERFLRKIAYLYYEEGQSQEAIAAKESYSRQMIGKALQKARERGIVRIAIVPDLRAGYLRNLSREVRLQLGLEDLVLVAGQSMNELAPEEMLDGVVTEIASMAAEYLDQLLAESDILAVSGGRVFLRNLVRYLKPSRLLAHLQVVATIGFVEARTTYGDANLIAHDLAEAYGANHLWFPAPAFLVDESQVQRTRSLPIIKEAYEMMQRASIVLTSVFPPHTNEALVHRQIITPEQRELIEAYRPAADINHWVFDEEGRCINELLTPPPYFLSGMEIPRLKDKIARGETKVLLIAGGSPAYVSAIRAVLHAGLANILVTDHVTAQLLLRDDD
ncbi:DNA-binding transcriptional regulator [Reticulibacter mediterranei]|uniref:DNA-binding transcriptional regulator n=1 Tax=Reticulibacter mediterranei TaxID=2778369 RepID=A0A8J3N9Y6_9CHLR|nr:sugar-binding domain-containing protein [Reticulibacter mediterranei]GHP01096.1 DNA-binding transcriptional regulator [Reticulibacter mediterranei]